MEARRIKTRDEVSLLAQACSMVDAAYSELYEFLRPGIRENECVGLVSKVLYDLGSEYVEGVNAISGERCSPHPHVYSDRLIRPGDPAFFDILHSHLGYRTCYYRTFAVGSASGRNGTPTSAAASTWTRPSRWSSRARPRPTSSRCGRGRPSSASPTRPPPSACSTATGSACPSGRSRSSAGWCRWTIPEPLEEGMVFALETYWPASDGWSAARIEEELVVTADGCEVITKFPAEELLVAGQKYWTAGGSLDTCARASPIGTRPPGAARPGSPEGMSRRRSWRGDHGRGIRRPRAHRPAHRHPPGRARLPAHGLEPDRQPGGTAGRPERPGSGLARGTRRGQRRHHHHARRRRSGPGILVRPAQAARRMPVRLRRGRHGHAIGPNAAREIAAEASGTARTSSTPRCRRSTALAEQGTLTTMVGGSMTAFERSSRLLGRAHRPAAPPRPLRCQAAMKLAVNIMIAPPTRPSPRRSRWPARPASARTAPTTR